MLEQNRGKPLLVNFLGDLLRTMPRRYPMLNELAKKYAPQG